MWVEVNKPLRGDTKNRQRIPVAVRCSSNKIGDYVTITIRPELLDGLPFWTDRQRVKVQLGQGQHQGQMRVTPHAAGSFEVRQQHRAKSANVPSFSLRVTLPCGSIPGPAVQTEVEFDYADDWIEITLPKAPAQDAAPPPVVKAPFRTAATAPDIRPAAGGR